MPRTFQVVQPRYLFHSKQTSWTITQFLVPLFGQKRAIILAFKVVCSTANKLWQIQNLPFQKIFLKKSFQKSPSILSKIILMLHWVECTKSSYQCPKRNVRSVKGIQFAPFPSCICGNIQFSSIKSKIMVTQYEQRGKAQYQQQIWWYVWAIFCH